MSVLGQGKRLGKSLFFGLCFLLKNLPSFNPTSPTLFRVGDVVEVKLSFVVVPLRAQQHKMIPVLRAVTLLDDTPTRVSPLLN